MRNQPDFSFHRLFSLNIRICYLCTAMKTLKDKKMFLLDMDGTIYIGNDLIPGAMDFLRTIEEQGKKRVFMTNNSSRNKFAYVEKLARLGIECSPEDIASSVNATACYLHSHKEGARIYLVGTESLKKELELEGFTVVPKDYRGNDVDCLLIGYDTELDYKKIEGACHYLCEGVDYYATNCDMRCPIEGGRYLPDCGSMCNMFEVATGRKPKYLGKPDRFIIDYIHDKWKVEYDDIVVIGDRLYTDIAVGVNAGVDSICVLSGECTMEDINASTIKPSYIFNSIKDVYENLTN